MNERTRQGYLYGIVAYGWWGLVPIYFKAVATVPALEVLLHRAVWSAVVLVLLISLMGRWNDLRRAFSDWTLLVPLAISAFLIACNWFVYILCVEKSEIRQASLGYFITPLVSVLLGLFVLGEHLRRLQWVAVILATLGVLGRIWYFGKVPYFSLSLATTFSLYALLRKKIPVDGLLGLTVETFVLTPAALIWLTLLHQQDSLAFTQGSLPWAGLLVLSGVVTVVPLLCFGQAARRLPLSALGFLQYLSPSIQLLLAVSFYQEALAPFEWACFGVIWLALLIYSLDSYRSFRRTLALQTP